MNRSELSVIVVLSFSVAGQAADPSASAPASGKPAPATVENRVKESDLTTVKLTPEAEKRLAVRIVAAEVKNVTRTRTYAGEVTIPPGRAIQVVAPVAGCVVAGSGATEFPAPWSAVERDAALMRLIPNATGAGLTFIPSDRISLARARADLTAARAEVAGQLKEAEVRVEAAQIKFNRADQLLREKAGSQKTVDEALAESEASQAAAKSAKQRLDALDDVLSGLESGEQAELPIVAPINGIIRSVNVAPGQIVASGTPLCEVIALDSLWIRVPVYVGEAKEFDGVEEAQVGELALRQRDSTRTAKRVRPPSSADSISATVDLFFELTNPDGRLRPGERLGVTLVTSQSDEGLVVPKAALLYDVFGGTWVYENTAAQTFVRRRVEVRDILGEDAVVSRGLAAGVNVVTDGAAELFGVEFGAGH